MISETLNIAINKTTQSRLAEFQQQELKFGRQFSDHMFVADYSDGAWGQLRIEPYQHITLSPATSALHYGQSIFEGMKGYRSASGEISLFRYEENMRRLNESAARMCMPDIPEDLFTEALFSLINLDRDWVPGTEGASLYIRPFVFATDEYIGIKPSDHYRFMIFTSPVGAYYSEPVRVKIENHYTRSAPGGTGAAKAAGNYAGSLYPAKLAQEAGYHQLVWTDAVEHKYIEESGTMNIMFMIGDTLITPSLSDSILAGITRDSVLTLAKDWGVTVEERKVEVAEVIAALKAGTLKEAFGTGTAATIAHISTIGHDGTDYELPPVPEREFSNKVLATLDGIKRGRIEDKYGWIAKV